MLMKNATSPNDGDLSPEGNSDNLIPSDCPNDFRNFFQSQSPSTATDGFHHHADNSRLNNLEGRTTELLHRCPFRNCCHSVTTQTSVPPTLPPSAPEMHAHHTSTRPFSAATDTCHRLRSPLVSRPHESALSKEDIKIVASRLLAQGFPAEALGTAAHQQFSQCHADIRKAAVECMLAQLNLDAKTNSSTVNEIQKRLRRLENQVFCEAKSGLEYFILIATKLADVFYELQKARTT